jgi:glycosyltransferase involved in cell wall biosynthesis
MRILHVATRHRRGGAERNLLHTAEWELRRGHEVHLAVGRDSLVADVPDGLHVHVLRHLVRQVSPVEDLRALRSLQSLIGSGIFDVVHTHQSKAGILGRLAARGQSRRVVHTIHMASFGPSYGRIGSQSFLQAERLCARVTDVIVSVGNELREMYLAAGVGRPDQYLVVRSPIDIERFAQVRRVTTEERASARASLGLPSGRVIVTAAALEPRKRVDLVIEALAPNLRSGSVVLAIAGDGDQRAALEGQVESFGLSGSVRFLGHVEDMPGLLSITDLLVHAASVEGVPQVVIQALAAGVPVVASEMIGVREVPEATVIVVDASGKGLSNAVRTTLSSPPDPVPLTAFDEWLSDGVDRGLANLHARLMVGATTEPDA